jgi:hypothetical protein
MSKLGGPRGEYQLECARSRPERMLAITRLKTLCALTRVGGAEYILVNNAMGRILVYAHIYYIYYIY